MKWAGVVSQGGGVTRNYNIHVLTLQQVPTLLRMEGTWPEPVSLSAGWFRARARPWNESVVDPMVRLDRGGSEFLTAVTSRLIRHIGATAVYSPALYGGSTRVWRRSGFADHAALDIMERGMNRPPSPPSEEVRLVTDPEWEEVLEVDRLAFEGFWGMSDVGLREAFDTSRASALLLVPRSGQLAGYAMVGVQWGTAYLHRIAVRPDASGNGLGASLISAAIEFGYRSGGRSMVLNVRPENSRAKRLYERAGFTNTGTTLQVLRYRGS